MEQKEKTLIAASILVVLAIPAVTWVAASQPKPYFVASGSMEPTLATRSTIPIQQHPYQSAAQVRRGDVVLYATKPNGSNPMTTSLKRVIGLPGDRVKLVGDKVWVNGTLLAHRLVRRIRKVSIYQEQSGQASYQVQYGDNTTPAHDFAATVLAGEFFCLGDNRDNALDSRYTGPVPFASIAGKPLTK
ncbi:MAG: signal peptidase I [Abitibacteriaceae bacterium]|nr:signal peptidase I [Abditibacteriaceae bacterium]MBV9867100.1 signal peptidase I [Abditibacteriaceae bacterium]